MPQAVQMKRGMVTFHHCQCGALCGFQRLLQSAVRLRPAPSIRLSNSAFLAHCEEPRAIALFLCGAGYAVVFGELTAAPGERPESAWVYAQTESKVRRQAITTDDNARGPSGHANSGGNANDPNGHANNDAMTRPSTY
ncbi:MAG TPA: hypothetical protein VFN63_06435 [Pseudolabrys sp.]|nr:hypothetical protein [Pseudolabrys sp.]